MVTAAIIFLLSRFKVFRSLVGIKTQPKKFRHTRAGKMLARKRRQFLKSNRQIRQSAAAAGKKAAN